MQKATKDLQNANRELYFQNIEKEKRAAELVIANTELAFQNKEKEKRAAELVVANIELAYQNTEKENRAAELVIANKELVFQNEEKEKRAQELIASNLELEKHVLGMKEMMFVTSHKIRQPLSNILGICSQLEQPQPNSTQNVVPEWITHIKRSALLLDDYTKELTELITALAQERKNKL